MRRVVITGATSGFGKLLVEAFLRNGDFVIATGRNLDERKEILSVERSLYSERLLELRLDVTNITEIDAAVDAIVASVAGVDVLINNAGYGVFGALEDLKFDEIRYQMEVNFFGTLNVTKAFLPLLRSSRGKIFNFSSVFGFMGFPLTSLYCASKFAVEGLTESLRGELAPHGVQVCLIEPGGYPTNFGENLSWSASQNSIYHRQVKNYRELRLRVAKRSSQNPEEISQGVLRLSMKRKLPMRRVFGRDGRASYLLRRFLPQGLYFNLLDFLYKKIF